MRGWMVFDGQEAMGLNDEGFVTHEYENRDSAMFFVRFRDADLWRRRLKRIGAKCYNPPFDVRRVTLQEEE